MNDDVVELISEYWSDDKTRRVELILDFRNVYFVHCYAVFDDNHEEFFDGKGPFTLLITAQKAAKDYVTRI